MLGWPNDQVKKKKAYPLEGGMVIERKRGGVAAARTETGQSGTMRSQTMVRPREDGGVTGDGVVTGNRYK